MGSAYKKNMKNILGRDDVTGHDVLHVGSGVVLAAQAAARLKDGNNVDTFIMPRRARLEGVVANLQGATLTSGNIGLELWAGGVKVGSGSFGSAKYLQILLDKENDNEILLSEGSVVFLNLGADVSLSSAQGVSARIHLTMLE
jgi:hypothetical protein